MSYACKVELVGRGVARRALILFLLLGESCAVRAAGKSSNGCVAAGSIWSDHLTLLALLALFLGLLVVGRSRSRVGRLARQKQELSLVVMLRTRQIQREKKTIELQKDQIEKLLEKAQQSNRLKDEFLANISHEIRTPLHGILGMTELALASGLTAEQHEYLDLASTSAQSLLALVNEVLDFSKIESGRFELACLSFSVRECVQGALGALSLSARNKGLRFVSKIDEEVPGTIEGDPNRLRQILVNLAGNAIKFTEHGSVTVLVSIEECMLCIRVVDTGIGIPADKREDIFEPFRQVDGSTSRKYGGTGLGLAISARLARDMHGSLMVDSQEGHGSTFLLKIPLSLSRARTASLETADSLQLTA
ncbi:MAG: sensor histidine kinase [Bryobacteraceae bacterium]